MLLRGIFENVNIVTLLAQSIRLGFLKTSEFASDYNLATIPCTEPSRTNTTTGLLSCSFEDQMTI